MGQEPLPQLSYTYNLESCECHDLPRPAGRPHIAPPAPPARPLTTRPTHRSPHLTPPRTPSHPTWSAAAAMGYLTVLRSPQVARLLFGTLLGRLPAGMTVVAIALALHAAGSAYTQIGLTTAAYAIAAAIGGPVLGRAVDRIGQPRVLLASAAVAACGYVALAVAPGSAAVAMAGAALAGAAMPPLEPCLRSLWPDIVVPAALETAYALDSASQQLLYVAGPLLVAGVAVAADPTAALWLAAGLGLLGTLAVATSAPARAWRAPTRTPPQASDRDSGPGTVYDGQPDDSDRTDGTGRPGLKNSHSIENSYPIENGRPGGGWLGPLRSPGLVLLLLAFAGTGWSVGAQNILFVAYAQTHPGIPGGAGALLALAALAGLLGALAYGAIRWTAPTSTRTWALAGGMAVCYLPLLLVPGPGAMGVAAFVSGLGLAPLLAAAFVLIAELAPAGTTTEAFAWLVTLFATGNALGSAVTGTVVSDSLRSAAAIAVGGITVAALLLLTTRKVLAAGVAAQKRTRPIPAPVQTTAAAPGPTPAPAAAPTAAPAPLSPPSPLPLPRLNDDAREAGAR
ncbi:MFS transporter [Streptacidiphilus cavernicola]|uniref:MFS transporter n=1 Tax=Streptacidiphilus cavernicola TaxID=3342716 RepID=A0ABV6W1W4_9ACTN